MQTSTSSESNVSQRDEVVAVETIVIDDTQELSKPVSTLLGGLKLITP